MVNAEAACLQIIGQRETQQDTAAAVQLDEVNWLLVLADGMGGQVGGKEASDIAVRVFQQAFVESEGPGVRDRFLQALQSVNNAIYDYVEQHPDMDGMGTTLVAVVSDGEHIQWLSVGDSPMWLIRDNEIYRLNENHSMAAVLQQQAEAGEITVEEALTSPLRSQLLEAVMGDDISLIDAPETVMEFFSGDTLIIASDGVETCSDEELIELTTANTANTSDMLAGNILSAVEQAGKPGQDNATIIVFKHARANASHADADTVPGTSTG